MSVDNPLIFPIRDLNEHPGPWGLTLRDYFAGQALTVVNSGGLPKSVPMDELAPAIAKACYRIADAMLSARKQEK